MNIWSQINKTITGLSVLLNALEMSTISEHKAKQLTDETLLDRDLLFAFAEHIHFAESEIRDS
jgi:hypothetical protein